MKWRCSAVVRGCPNSGATNELLWWDGTVEGMQRRAVGRLTALFWFARARGSEGFSYFYFILFFYNLRAPLGLRAAPIKDFSRDLSGSATVYLLVYSSLTLGGGGEFGEEPRLSSFSFRGTSGFYNTMRRLNEGLKYTLVADARFIRQTKKRGELTGTVGTRRGGTLLQTNGIPHIRPCVCLALHAAAVLSELQL